VDSGCYGTLIRSLIVSNHIQDEGKLPAVFFFHSRNPHIFGYMNYLTFSHYGLFSNSRFHKVNPLDLAVIASDTLEAIPKAYVIRDTFQEHAEVTSLLSFILAISLYADLYQFAQQQARRLNFVALNKQASAALRCLWNGYQQRLQGRMSERTMFWIPPTPKWKAGKEWLSSWDLGTLPPQTEIFGVLAG